MSFYKFWARTGGGPQVEQALSKELSVLGARSVSSLRRLGYGAVEFRASWPILWNIIYKARVVESIQLKVGTSFSARGKKELQSNIGKLPWHAFLPFREFEKYRQVEIKARCHKSKLFHDGLVK